MSQSSKASAFSGSSGAKASQLPASGEGMQSKSITTKGGSEITVAGGKGSGTTPGGATIGGAGGAVKVEGPGGNTAAKGGAVAGGSKNGNTAVAGGSAKGIETAGGAKAATGKSTAAIAGAAGGAAIASRGASAIQGKGGTTAANVRGGYASTAGVARVGSATAIRGPNGNTIAAGRGAAFTNGQFVGGRTWAAVNGNFGRWNYFTPGWIGRYPGAWWPGKWAVAATAWWPVTWGVLGGYCGYTESPVYYDYYDNVTYEGDMVYYGDQPVASAEAYYDQAAQIADAGTDTENEDWLPLGVFAVVTDEQTTTDKLLQLAVNKEGVIRGNYQDMITDKLTPLIGSVDKETQRVAIKVEGNDLLVAETGLYNLTNDEAPLMIHFGADRQEVRTLVRLQQPEEEK
jgi:hypothetical protein